MAWLDLAAQDEFGTRYASLTASQQNALQFALKQAYRTNSYDKTTDTLTLSDRRVQAIMQTAEHYISLFGDDMALSQTRANYAMKNNTLPSLQRRQQLTQFFFWTAWAASTERTPDGATYTNNWPHEPLIDNRPTAENLIWSLVSIILLIAGVGGLIWGWAFLRKHDEEEPAAPKLDPIARLKLTPSQKALGKYILVVVALFTLQVFLGGFTAHYTVEGDGFYGLNTTEWLPYSLARTWHIQAAMFWIATGFLAAGLFLAPIINGGKILSSKSWGSMCCFGHWWYWWQAPLPVTTLPSCRSCLNI
jgi:nitric oxide reductase subunit B